MSWMDAEMAADWIFSFLGDVMGDMDDPFVTSIAKLMDALEMDQAAVRGGLGVLAGTDDFEVFDPKKDIDLDPEHITRGRPIMITTTWPIFRASAITEMMDGWIDAGWIRILPPQSYGLVTLIGGPNGRGLSSSLDDAELLVTHPETFGPDGLDSPINWDFDEDPEWTDEERALDAERRTNWESFVTTAGYEVPRTVRELAELLAVFKVFEHTPATDTTPERWDPTWPFPSVVDTLPVDDDYAASEAKIVFAMTNYPYASAIIGHVEGDLDRPGGPIPMRLDRLAETVELGLDNTRVGLQLLVNDEDFTLTGPDNQPVDPTELSDTGEFFLTVDWDMFEDTRIHIAADD